MATTETYYEKNARYERENKINVTELKRLSDAVKSSGGYISARLPYRTTERYDEATAIIDEINKLYSEIITKYDYDKKEDYKSNINDLKDEIMYVINNYNWHVDIKKYPPLYDSTRSWEGWWSGKGRSGLSRVKHVRKSRKGVRKGAAKSQRRSRSGKKYPRNPLV